MRCGMHSIQSSTSKRHQGTYPNSEPACTLPGGCHDSQPLIIALEPVAVGLSQPVYVTSPPGDDRLFVVELGGRLRIVRNGRVAQRPFLDISALVSKREAQGSYGLAFHPQFSSNGFLYVSYSDVDGVVHIDRYTVSSDPDSVDRATRTPMLAIPQPHGQHNGGHLLFGPDRMTWAATGDGGYTDSVGVSPARDGRSGPFLGNLLRIDVNGDSAVVEIKASGLRNPWRFSFDSSGVIYIADVGHTSVEEINIEALSPGMNFGWPVMEGDECFGRSRLPGGLTMPKLTYRHDDTSCSIIGGATYRGRGMPALAGHYFYSDYCGGWVRSFRFANDRVTDETKWEADDVGRVVSFGSDAAGELYLVAEAGTIYRLALPVTRTRP